MTSVPRRSVDPVTPETVYVGTEVAIALAAATLGATPWLAAVRGWVTSRVRPLRFEQLRLAALGGELLCLAVIFVGAAAKLASGTHNPFIYFRF